MTDKICVVYGGFIPDPFEEKPFCNVYNTAGVLEETNVLNGDLITTVYCSPYTNRSPYLLNGILPVQPLSSPGSSTVNILLDNSPAVTLASGFLSDGQENIWYSPSVSDIIWGQHRYGTESTGSPYARDARSLVRWNHSGTWSVADVIYPTATIGNVTYDYANGLAKASSTNSDSLIVLAQPNTDQDTHNTLAATVYDYDSGTLLRSGLIDSTQANGVFIGGGPMYSCISQDGNYLAYFHHGLQPGPTDYPDVHYLNRVKISDLTVVSSQTPSAASAPVPWNGTTFPQPMLSFAFGVASISKTGKYIFICDNVQTQVAPHAYPYALWNAESNVINYRESMANISGLTGADYIPINIPGGYMSTVFDSNDNLWATMMKSDGSGFKLLKFNIVANDLVCEFANDIVFYSDENPVAVGSQPNLLLTTISTSAGPQASVRWI